MENSVLNFDKALQILTQASDSFTLDVWIPSLNKNVVFKQLDAKQQKELLSSVMDTSVYNVNFIKTFYNILKTNITEKDISVDSFTLFDKIIIALCLKKQISKNINVVFDEKLQISEKFDIDDILEKTKTYITPEPFIAESSNEKFSIKVELTYPTVKKEYDYDTDYKKNKKTEDLKSTEEVQNIISEAFIGETSKYINKIWINDNEIDCNKITIHQKIRIIETFPSSLVQKILEQIAVWKKSVDDALTVKKTLDNKEYTKVISVDSLMFFN
jgi:hypothetical protein